MKNTTIKIESLILNGSLTMATAKCGNPNCKCQKNKKDWHGPYYRWTGSSAGKRTTVTLSDSQVKVVKKALFNYQKLTKQLENLILESMQRIRSLPR